MDKKLLNFIIRDPTLQKANKENKDLYSVLASILFNRTYEECLESDKKGNQNLAGKKRRLIAKQIILSLYTGDYTLLSSLLEEYNIDYKTPEVFSQSGYVLCETHTNPSIKVTTH